MRSPDTARQHALRAGPWCAGKMASEAQQVADKLIADMRGHYRPATINRTLGALKAGLRLAFRAGLTSIDFGGKIQRLPENNARQVYLSIEEVRRLADCAASRCAPRSGLPC